VWPKLVITVTPVEGNTYRAEYTFTPPGGEVNTKTRTFTLDADKLNGTDLDPDEHGPELGAALFGAGTDADPTLPLWRQARDFPSPDDPLRVELVLPSDDEALRRVRWEALADPDPQTRTRRLLANQNLRFYRRLDCANPRLATRVRTRAAVRALVLVASPRNIDGAYADRLFKEHDALAGETGPIVAALAGIPTTVLVSDHKAAADANPLLTLGVPPRDNLDWGGRPSQKNLLHRLREGYDLVVVVAHGVLVDDRTPKLLLEDENGKAHFALGAEIADEIEALSHRPALVVVASCQSSGVPLPVDPDRPPNGRVRPDEADTALAACLGRAGVGAVLSMHGNVDRETATTFVRTFLETLTATGAIDGAAVEGRHAVADPNTYPDPWAPILASRLPANRLWDEPAPRASRPFDGWTRLGDRLKDGECIPVLGPGVLAHLVGSAKNLVDHWAAELEQPVPPGADWDVPRLAQRVVTQGADTVRKKYVKALQRALAAETGRPKSGDGAAALLADLTAAAEAAAVNNVTDVYALLARLRLPAYLTTCPDDAMYEALRRRIGPAPAGTPDEEWGPVRQVCNWLGGQPQTAEGVTVKGWPAEPVGLPLPTPDRPLVCHLGGHLSKPSSVLVSEDDYFRFLVRMAVASSRGDPTVLDEQISKSDLLFLGFRLDDLAFRTFVEVFVGQERVQNRLRADDGFDVAVQLDPDDAAAASARDVQEYVERLFKRHDRSRNYRVEIMIYWQGLPAFLNDLYNQCPTK